MRHLPRARRRWAVIGLLVVTATSAPAIAGVGASDPAAPPPAADASSSTPPGVWLAGDLHVHTTYSHDSYGGPGDDNTGLDEAYTLGLTVEEQFALAATRGLDYLAISDHNDVRSMSDPGFGSHGVLGVRGYENSLSGHAQMLGAGQLYDNGDRSTAAVQAVADQLRADGGSFQINHPAGESADYPAEVDWGYGDAVVPDTVEVWNISRPWQPPMPAGTNNDDAVRFWEGFLDQGLRVGATGGSDSHWAALSAAAGVGQPTTWVHAADRSETAVLAALRAGRTFISHQPPALGGPQLFLEADTDGDGDVDAMVGDEVPSGSALQVRAVGAPGSLLRVVTDGGAIALEPVPVTSPSFRHVFTLPPGATWARAELVEPDLGDERRATCDPALGSATTYCRNQLAVLALTSAIYLGAPDGAGGSAAGGSAHPTGVNVTIDGPTVTVTTPLVERTWRLDGFRTERLVDRRTGRLWSSGGPDFRLTLDGAEITSDRLTSTAPRVERRPGGATRLIFDLGVAERVVDVWPDVAGFWSQTTLTVSGAVSAYTLDEAAVGPDVAATAESFRAGADWRESDWTPSVSLGDPNAGDWRRTVAGGPGEPVHETAQVLDVGATDGSDARLFMVMERNDYASSTMRYDGTTASALVDLQRDLLYLGPIEESAHAENDTPLPARHRVIVAPQRLEAAFLGLATDADDEAIQHHRWLVGHRMPPWQRAVTFNTNDVDQNRISTGAKDDVDLAELRRQLAVAQRLGVETFVLDDGWQARSGDWCPDSEACPEPRAGRLPPRFPDDRFAVVRSDLAAAGMDLGLWMSPMHFHSSSRAFEANPQWSCLPVGTATAGLTALQPEDGSSEAGLGTWNPMAWGRHPDDGRVLRLVDYIEDRIERAIEVYGARYFKFDFLVWLDCAGAESVDLYRYRDEFVDLLDRLIARHPTVTFQIDETNDYRLFPFESIARGPSWFQNGHPRSDQLLHNLWSLAPWIPAQTLGQHLASRADERAERGVDWAMAVGLFSHLTFWDDLTTWSDADIAGARRWVDLYTTHRDRFSGVVFPLLDDPRGATSWTALQSWDADADRGVAVVYRQDDPAATRSVVLRGLDPRHAYRVTDAWTGVVVATVHGGQAVTVPLIDRFSAAVLLIDPA